MKNDGFATVDAVTAIALTGLLIAGAGPLYRAYASDFPEALARNREGIAFHHLARDAAQSMERFRIPYWSAGPSLQIDAYRLDVTAAEEYLVLIREGNGIRLTDGEGSRFYRFRSPPAWKPLEDPAGRRVGISLIHEDDLRIDVYFRERALGVLRDETR